MARTNKASEPVDEQQEVMMRLAGTIRLLREKEKLSLRDLADKAGVGHSDLFRLESGTTKNPTIFTVRKIAKALGLTVDELMNFDAIPCPTCGGRGWIKGKGTEEQPRASKGK